MLTIDPNRV
jgi:hypothetical protein